MKYAMHIGTVYFRLSELVGNPFDFVNFANTHDDIRYVLYDITTDI